MQAAQEDAATFRQSKLKLEAALQSIAVVLCNDKPQTFGAPDVLQLSTHQLIVQWTQDTEFPDRPPNQVLLRMALVLVLCLKANHFEICLCHA